MLTCALLRLGFPSAPPLYGLTLPASAARRTVLQKVRGPALAVPQLVNTGFQVLFHSPPGVLFTFPSQYSALSVTEEYSALRGGPRSFPLGFTCPVVLRIPAAFLPPSPTGLSPPMAALPRGVRLASLRLLRVLTPGCSASRFGLFPFRSPLLRKSMFSFFSSGYLDVSVRRVPLHALLSLPALFMHGCMRDSHAGFPIQTPMDHWIFAPPHGFSQLIASFFGSQCQGILPVLFPAWPPSRIALRKGAVSFFPRTFSVRSRMSLLSFLFKILIRFCIRFSRCFPRTFSSLNLLVRWNLWFVELISPLDPLGPVETKRFELSTPCLQGRCSPS